MTPRYTRAVERARALGYLPPPMARPMAKSASWRPTARRAPKVGPAHEIWPAAALRLTPTVHGVTVLLADETGGVANRRQAQSRAGASARLSRRQVVRALAWVERGRWFEFELGGLLLDRRPVKGDRIVFRDSRRRVVMPLAKFAAQLRQAFEARRTLLGQLGLVQDRQESAA